MGCHLFLFNLHNDMGEGGADQLYKVEMSWDINVGQATVHFFGA